MTKYGTLKATQASSWTKKVPNANIARCIQYTEVPFGMSQDAIDLPLLAVSGGEGFMNNPNKHIHSSEPFAQVNYATSSPSVRWFWMVFASQFVAHPAPVERPSRRCAIMCIAAIVAGLVGAGLL